MSICENGENTLFYFSINFMGDIEFVLEINYEMGWMNDG